MPETSTDKAVKLTDALIKDVINPLLVFVSATLTPEILTELKTSILAVVDAHQ